MPCDPYRNSTVLLLHCNGSNGSTSFTDSSPTPKTVTATGNAQISTAQSKFGGASAYFDGAGDYLTVPSSAAFDFSGDFTVEMFVRLGAVSSAMGILDKRQALSARGISIFFDTAGGNKFWCCAGDANTAAWEVALSSGNVVVGQFYHLAFCRGGTTFYAFVNGLSIGVATWAGSIDVSTSPLLVGALFGPGVYFNGYIDELRITKGVARYTADFTPPAAAFPDSQCAISGVVGQVGAPLERLVRLYRRDTGTLVGQTLSSPSTGAYSIQTSVEGEHFALVHDTANGDPFFQNVSLLLPMDGSTASTSFADLSPNKKVVTSAGGAQISTAQSKFGGSSALFDGVDDFLTVPANTDLDFGSGDFTIELFVMFASVPTGGNYAALVTRRDSGTTNISYNLWYGGTEKFHFSFSANGTTQINSATLNTTTPAPNQWYHIAMVRSGTNVDIYVDGTKGTAHNIGTSALFTSTSVLRIGAANSTPTFFLNGYIDDLRITKGVARYTANFTPPTAPYPSGVIGGDLNAVIYDRLIPA